MLAVLFLLIAGDPSTSPTLVQTGRVTINSSSYFASQDPIELERRVRNSFDLTDRNHDGFVDLSEAPIAERGRHNADGERVAEEASNALWIRLMDQDSDMRVDWPEMREYLLPGYLRDNGL